MNEDLKLARGRALVLTGPQGCGKTETARAIAAAHGSYREVKAEVLDSYFGLGTVLVEEPDTLIIEGAPATAGALGRSLAIIANEEVIADRKGLEPKIVKSPHLIFCVCESVVLDLGPDDRRFHVVRL